MTRRTIFRGASLVFAVFLAGGAAMAWNRAYSQNTPACVPQVFSNALVFSVPGTCAWTVPQGVTQIKVKAWGAGGGGGTGWRDDKDKENRGGAGGGGGGFAESALSVVSGATYQVTVGKGGVGHSNSLPVAPAGNSEFVQSGTAFVGAGGGGGGGFAGLDKRNPGQLGAAGKGRGGVVGGEGGGAAGKGTSSGGGIGATGGGGGVGYAGQVKLVGGTASETIDRGDNEDSTSGGGGANGGKGGVAGRCGRTGGGNGCNSGRQAPKAGDGESPGGGGGGASTGWEAGDTAGFGANGKVGIEILSVSEPAPPMPTFAPLDYFSLTNSGDITVMQGEFASNMITAVKGKDAFSGMVLLSHNVKIENASVSLQPAAVPVGGKSEFLVSAAQNTPPGVYAASVVAGKTAPILGGTCTTTHKENGNDIDCTSIFRNASLQLSSGGGVSFPGAIEFYGKFADAVCSPSVLPPVTELNWTTVKGSSALRLGQNGGVGSFKCTDLAATQLAKTTAFKVTVTARPPDEVRTPSTGKHWDGWIKLSGTAKDGSKYGVKYDPKTTRFCGYAWGGEVMGWVQFGPLVPHAEGPKQEEGCSRAPTKYDWVRLETTQIDAQLDTKPILPPAPTVHPYDGIVVNKLYRLTGYAWSSNIGWIQMGASPLGECGKDGVVCMNASVPGAVERKLIGWAWSPNMGWVKFDAEALPSYPEAPSKSSYLNIKDVADGNGTPANTLGGWARVCSATVKGDCASATGEYRGQ